MSPTRYPRVYLFFLGASGTLHSDGTRRLEVSGTYLPALGNRDKRPNYDRFPTNRHFPSLWTSGSPVVLTHKGQSEVLGPAVTDTKQEDIIDGDEPPSLKSNMLKIDYISLE